MIRDGMSKADMVALQQTLRRSHYIRVQVDVLDRDERHAYQLGARIVEGSVDIDATADITRSATITILDPQAKLQWVPDSPAEAAVYADNFIRIRYGVLTSAQGWVDVPVFWGPVISIERQGPLATIHAVGKESLGLAPAVNWVPALKVSKGAQADDAIAKIMRSLGERRFAMAVQTARLPRTLSLKWDTEPWAVAKGIARGANRQLFYDGLGRVRLREYGFRPVYSFRTGAGGDILQEPALTFDLGAVRNTVRVQGPIREKDKTRQVHAQAVALASNPLSPAKLQRNGAFRHLVDGVDVPKVRSLADARGIARRRLKADLLSDVQVQLETLPVPHLEEGDMVALRLRGAHYLFRVTGLSLPLVATSPMTVNVVRRVRSRRARG